MLANTVIKINEIFFSLQGESSRIGLPTVFIRLTGCPMRCNYCDTAYAFNGGENLTIHAILAKVASYKTQYITVTGGEPLAQRECLDLLTTLCDSSYEVSLETGGALSIKDVDPRVKVILDIKTPGSGEVKNYHWPNLNYLKAKDEIKLVITDHEDYLWAKNTIQEKNLLGNFDILFSPSFEQVESQDLAEWILKDQLPVRLQLQLHKILWGQKPGV
ncbi:MAG: 7-carboxy-7-deazaguanine synthase QueE [Proteobacteria bacterium]|nr:7-carboxy-7-deazaguanine synthase QueE [Pseudomonadota bacterium]